MKRLLPLFLLLAACVSQHKDEALFPPLSLAWPGVEADLLRGIDDGVTDGLLGGAERSVLEAQLHDLAKAIKERDAVETRAEWTGTEPGDVALIMWAQHGVQDQVDDGDIGPGAAASLLERIKNFDAAIAALPLE